jgi:uncharacterized protein with HEPN domain
LLDDIFEACAFVGEATADTTLTDYTGNRRLRFAIERNFEIIGEALLRLERILRPRLAFPTIGQ